MVKNKSSAEAYYLITQKCLGQASVPICGARLGIVKGRTVLYHLRTIL